MKVSELIGKTFDKVEIDESEDQIIFHGEKSYRLFHSQDCCESVVIKDVCGDVADLSNTPIVMAIESSNENDENGYESNTWTFYRFATNKGGVVICWRGSSNGYYSESVDFEEMK